MKLILNCPRALGITCLSNKGQFFFFTKDNFQGLAVALTGFPVVINSSLYSVFAGKKIKTPALVNFFFSRNWSRNIYKLLYNDQINARDLIAQSPVGYCVGKPKEKSLVF